MGCCYSFFCNDDNSSQSRDPNERTHLLIDPVSNNANLQRVNRVLMQECVCSAKKTDEQSSLNRILQDTATSMIDVAALDSHNLQQHEYLERMKIYNVKVQQVLANSRYRFSRKAKCCLQDIPNPEIILNSDPIDNEDLNLIMLAVSSAASAMNDIKVDHKEDLVVPFGLTS